MEFLFIIILNVLLIYSVVKIGIKVSRVKETYRKDAPVNKYKSEEDFKHFETLPYRQRYILTSNEYFFYKELKKITDKNNLLICPKVGLKDLFLVTDKKTTCHGLEE